MDQKQIERLSQQLASSDAIVIGAGAGLSTSAGFTYTGERFEHYFPDFIAKYHFSDMYSGGFYPFDTLEEHWAYWSRYIFCKGTPQGGIISPLLANIVLNELDNWVESQWQNHPLVKEYGYERKIRNSITFDRSKAFLKMRKTGLKEMYIVSYAAIRRSE